MTKKAIAIVPNNKPPAVERAWPPQKQIREVTERLDGVADYLQRLRVVRSELKSASWMTEQSLKDAQNTIDWFSCLGWKSGVSMKALEEEMWELYPDHWLDDDDTLSRSSVSMVLAKLMGSFPTSNIPDTATFTLQLLEDVMELAPSFPELEAACRKLRQSKKFMPAICEVVEAIKAEKAAWERREQAVWNLDCVHEEATKLLEAELTRREAEKQKREAEEKEREAENQRRIEILNARVMPICVGDRVRDPKLGHGTVKEINEIDYAGPPGNRNCYNCYFVVFDEGGEVPPRYIAGPFGPTHDNYYHVVFDDDGPQRSGGPFFLERLAACEDAKPAEDDASRGGA